MSHSVQQIFKIRLEGTKLFHSNLLVFLDKDKNAEIARTQQDNTTTSQKKSGVGYSKQQRKPLKNDH